MAVAKATTKKPQPSNETKLAKCGLAGYHEIGLDGRDKVVVVLDEKPYIRPNIMDKEIFSAPLGQGNSATHATQCAQVLHIAAPKAKVVMLPFMNTEDRLASIKWIKEHKVDLINMSLSLQTAENIYPILKDLNIPIIAAAGNHGADSQIAEPACFDWTIAVGGWQEGTDSIYIDNCHGDSMDCVTYTGIDIESKPGYVTPMTGTSASAPWLCGMLACYFTGYSLPDVYTLREFIKENCIDVEEKGKDKGSGYGFFQMPTFSNRLVDKYLKAGNTVTKPSEVITQSKEKIEITMTLGAKEATVNGKTVKLDCASIAKDGRTLVSLRFVAETLGCNVDYNKGQITITK